MPGCVTEGKNLEDAFENATDAASGWVLDELEEGNVVPKSSDYDSVERREVRKCCKKHCLREQLISRTACKIALDIECYFDILKQIMFKSSDA